MKFILPVVVLLLVFQTPAYPQIPDVEVQIVNPLKVTLPAMERPFDKIQVRAPEPVYPPLVYEVAPLVFKAPPFRPGLRPLKIRMPDPETVYRGYVSLGFGNYTSPFAEAYFPLLSGKQSSAGVRFQHQSFLTGPVDGKNSASGKSALVIDFRSPGKKFLTEGLVGWRNNYSGFYGYAPGSEVLRSDIEHGYNQVQTAWTIQRMGNSPVSLIVMPSFRYLWDNLSAAETDVSIGFKFGMEVGRSGKLEWEGDYDVLAREDEQVEAKPRHLAQTSVRYSFSPISNMEVKAGLRVAAENDTLLKKDVHVYPLAHAVWRASNRVEIAVSVTGGVENVSLYRLSTENLWLDRNITLAHGNRLLETGAEVKAMLGGGASVRAGIQYASFGNQYFFLNSAAAVLNGDRSKFTMVYDDATRTDFFAAFLWQKGSSMVNLRGDYFNWSTDNLAYAFHRPSWQFEFTGQFRIASRLLLRPAWMMRGGIRALENDGTTTTTLPVANDLALQADYNFSARGSLFIRGNNLLNQSYSLFQFYPVRGLQATAGLTWKF